MKRYLLDPHLMLMGFLTLTVLSFSSTLKAQEDNIHTESIIITNGDTIINGKKLSEASHDERIRLKKEFNKIEDRIKSRNNEERLIVRKKNGKDHDITIERKFDEPHVLHWKSDDMNEFESNGNEKLPQKHHFFKFYGDSLVTDFDSDTIINVFKFKLDGLDSNLRKQIITLHRDMDLKTPRRFSPPQSFDRMESPGFRNRNNTSSYSYNHTDKNGISSRMNIRISEVDDSYLKKVSGIEKVNNTLDIKDLTLFPNFSNGKMGLSFNLETKGTIKIKLLNSDLKQIFTDEVSNLNGNYMKQVALTENGVYYISINQNGNWYIRKLIKE